MRLIRLFLMLIAGSLLATAAPAQQARDWRTNVVMSPSGAYLVGNPAAKVKLVEYLSFTCGHCAKFVAESKAPLHDDLVRRGQVRVEYRHAIRDPLDLTASLLARCSLPRNFASVSTAIFAAQRDWYGRGAQWWQANGAAMQSQPEIAQLKAIAEASGLAALMRKQGMTDARIDQCFASDTDLIRVTTMSGAAWKAIKGTPSFVINGKAGGGSEWATLQPELRAAGAR
ncbi:MAG: hypothetical protein CVT77_04445 [Alphaproteobacteria bacterium HGW-Alphaproteobacteria-16]|nr:MAG: hypothetical protein CVT77_04445 [Alphaproteobacteria bacterium HGW-Alphaproteobacteria-16]